MKFGGSITVESKYLFNFRKFNSYSFEQLKFLAKTHGITYNHPTLSKRELAKKLAVISYHCGGNHKPDDLEAGNEIEQENVFNPESMEVDEDEV
jgi:hypothetical protein